MTGTKSAGLMAGGGFTPVPHPAGVLGPPGGGARGSGPVPPAPRSLHDRAPPGVGEGGCGRPLEIRAGKGLVVAGRGSHRDGGPTTDEGGDECTADDPSGPLL